MDEKFQKAKEINGYWTGAVTCPECKADNKVERW